MKKRGGTAFLTKEPNGSAQASGSAEAKPAPATAPPTANEIKERPVATESLQSNTGKTPNQEPKKSWSIFKWFGGSRRRKTRKSRRKKSRRKP